MDEGYIKIHRKIVKWQWYQDINTFRLFFDLLLDANYEKSKNGFLIIEKGQVLTSLKRMSERTGLTYQQIRTSLGKLEKSGEINKQTTNANTIITINNWCQYQESNKRITNEQQTNNNIKEYKEEKEYKEINIKEKYKKEKIEKKYFESLKVNTIFNEFLELRKKLKAINSERAINSLINKLNNYDEETQYKMIEQSIVNSWKGLFEIKERKDNVLETLKKIYNE